MKNLGPIHFQTHIVWESVVFLVLIHTLSLWSLYILPKAKIFTYVYTVVLAFFTIMGLTAGSHRLWSHRSYKARLPLRVFLMLWHTVAFQRHIIRWAKDHRVHHKYTDTNADPHNTTRGFFFSHVGWLLCRKHPDVTTKGNKLDISDLEADPVLQFQRRYYLPLALVTSMILPMAIPVIFWQERALISFLVCIVLRLVYTYHVAFSGNSIAHMWGNRPYDKNISPTDNAKLDWFTLGEGFHNYHHTFPGDYSSSEFGLKINPTTQFINFMAFIGQAYDLKTANAKLIKQRAQRTGQPQNRN